MKPMLKLALLLLAHSCWAEDKVDAFIESYLGTAGRQRLEFDWSGADSVDRRELTERLHEVVDGKRETIGSGAGINSTAAKIMLIGIGDEAFIQREMSRWQSGETLSYEIVRNLVDTGQVLGVPYLAVDLTSSEHIDFHFESGGDISFLRPSRFLAAGSIVGIVDRSAKLPEAVRASARAILDYELDLRRRRALTNDVWMNYVTAYVNVVTQWWQQNRNAIDAGRYTEVKPLAAPDTIGAAAKLNTANASAETGMNRVEGVQPDTDVPKGSARSESDTHVLAAADSEKSILHAWWLWVAGVGALVGVALMLWRRR